MVSAIESLAAQAGDILVTEAGCRRFGGHTPRVSGSRYWASQGLELFKMQILARCGSAVILRDVAEAPLQSITTDIKKRMSVHKVWDAISELDKTLSEVRLKPSEEGQVRSRTEEKESQTRDHRDEEPSWVINPKSGVWHTPLLFGTQIHPSVWRARCGWTFGGAAFEVIKGTSANHRVCDRCVPNPAHDPSQEFTEDSEVDEHAGTRGSARK